MGQNTIGSFELSRQLAGLVAKEYAKDFFKLLVMYRNISASEAAARLGLHIKTAQDFLEGLEKAGILDKHEAAERKRPYFRYTLKQKKLHITLDLDDLHDPEVHASYLSWKIREKKNSEALFKEGREGRISSVLFFHGRGRLREERRFNLTDCQGRFLLYLPFPTEQPSTVEAIFQKSGLSRDCLPEITDLLEILKDQGVIEKIASSI